MRITTVFLLLVGVLAASANVVPEFLQDDIVFEESDSEVISEDNIDWESLRPAIEEWAATGEVSDDDDEDNEVTDIDVPRYELEGCRKGRCDVCFKVWKLRGCIVAELVSNGIRISFQYQGRTLYSKIIRAKNYTIKIKSSKLPSWLRKYVKSDITIQVTNINPKARTFCVQLSLKVRWVGTVRWPRRRPKCFKL